MRVLIFVLVLCNLLFFAFTQGYFGYPDNPDAQRMQQQLHPERIQLMDEPAQAPKAPDKPAVEAAGPRCLAWNGLLEADRESLQSRLAKRVAGLRLKAGGSAATGTWWVYVPPLSNRQAADSLVEALGQAGVVDILALQDGPNRHAVSLGIFSSEEAANLRLKEVVDKGFDKARVAPRRKDAGFSLEVRGTDAELAEARKLAQIWLKDARPVSCK